MLLPLWLVTPIKVPPPSPTDKRLVALAGPVAMLARIAGRTVEPRTRRVGAILGANTVLLVALLPRRLLLVPLPLPLPPLRLSELLGELFVEGDGLLVDVLA